MSTSRTTSSTVIVAAILAIVVSGAAIGAGTFALFSDTETESGSLDAGTLTLDTGTSQTLTFSSSNIKPTDTGNGFADLSPSGSLTGDLNVTTQSLGTTVGKDSSANLSDHVEFKVWLDENASDDGTYDSTPDIGLKSDGTTGSPAYATVSSYESTDWGTVITGMSNDWSIHIEWKFPSSATDNEAQGDAFTATFEFILEQQ